MQRTRFALIALVVGLLGLVAVSSVWLYFQPPEAPRAPAQAARPEPPKPKPLPVVLAASRDLAVGSLITANDIGWSTLRNGTILPGHLRQGQTQPADVVGAVVRRAVFKGAPLTWSSMVRPGQHGFLAAALKPNHRAVTILVNRATSQAGLIYPGDRVDVILTVEVKGDRARDTNTFAGTILEDIRVVAVDRQVESGASGQPTRSRNNTASTVTLEVLPAQAERLILADSSGKISLAMRSLTDGRQHDDRQPTDFNNLLALPSAEPQATPVAQPAPPLVVPPPRTAPDPDPEPARVHIFRGDKREEVLVEER